MTFRPLQKIVIISFIGALFLIYVTIPPSKAQMRICFTTLKKLEEIKMIRWGVLFLILNELFLNFAWSKDHKLLSVTNNSDHNFYELFIEASLQDNIARSLKMYDKEEKSWKHFSISNLRAGVTLKKEGGHKVIILRSTNFELHRGGEVVVDYLSNGIRGKRKNIGLNLDFDGTEWCIFHKGEKVALLDFKVKKFMGSVIGIKRVKILSETGNQSQGKLSSSQGVIAVASLRSIDMAEI
jgi:hypothetical protein